MVCSPPSVRMVTFAGPSVRAKTGTWRLMMRIALIVRMNILLKSRLDSPMFMGFRNFPQAVQKCCLFSEFWLQWLQGVIFGFVAKSWILKIFSDRVSRMMVPMKMRIQPPSRWNAWMATSIPYWFPISTVTIIRVLLRL